MGRSDRDFERREGERKRDTESTAAASLTAKLGGEEPKTQLEPKRGGGQKGVGTQRVNQTPWHHIAIRRRSASCGFRDDDKILFLKKRMVTLAQSALGLTDTSSTDSG